MAPNNYCFAIDVRCMSFTEPSILPLKSCFVQYSYAFFGFMDKVKTSRVSVTEVSQITFEDGFCAFNFATTESHLRQTLKNIPLIMEIMESTGCDDADDDDDDNDDEEADSEDVDSGNCNDLLLGTAKLCLYDIIDIVPNCDQKTILSHEVPVLNGGNEEIGIIQVIMCLQNWGEANIGEIRSLPMITANGEPIVTNEITSNQLSDTKVDMLLSEAAYEIEVWKEEQLAAFKEDLQRKESEYFELLDQKLSQKTSQKEAELSRKMVELSKLESKLESCIASVTNKEKDLMSKESEFAQKQQALKNRFEKLDTEISKAIADLKANFEAKFAEAKEKLKLSTEEKNKLHSKIYNLERKLKEKDEIIKCLEDKLKSSSVARLHSAGSSIPRRSSNDSSDSKVVQNPVNNNKGYKVFDRARTRSADPSKIGLNPKASTTPVSSNSTTTTTTTVTATSSTTLVDKRRQIPIKISSADSKLVAKESKKASLLAEIEKEKFLLLRSGLDPEDSLIREIDSRLQMSLTKSSIATAKNSRPMGNNTKDKKAFLLAQIEKEREQLIKSGVNEDESIIKEIDVQLEKHKLKSK